MNIVIKCLLTVTMTSIALGARIKHKNEARNKRAEFRDDDNLQVFDPRCNSERLRAVMKSAGGHDATMLKRNIQMLAEQQFKARYNVICAEDDFSYITNTEEYCQETLAQGRTCYVFRQLGRLTNTATVTPIRHRRRLRKLRVHK